MENCQQHSVTNIENLVRVKLIEDSCSSRAVTGLIPWIGIDKHQVYRVPICMGWFGTETMKPTYLFANHKCFAATLMQEFVLLHCNDFDQV